MLRIGGRSLAFVYQFRADTLTCLQVAYSQFGNGLFVTWS